MTDARVERLSVDDCSANVELSRSVGWKDVESEWRTLHAAASEVGRRDEMTWGVARAPWQVPQRFALASLAWG